MCRKQNPAQVHFSSATGPQPTVHQLHAMHHRVAGALGHTYMHSKTPQPCACQAFGMVKKQVTAAQTGSHLLLLHGPRMIIMQCTLHMHNPCMTIHIVRTAHTTLTLLEAHTSPTVRWLNCKQATSKCRNGANCRCMVMPEPQMATVLCVAGTTGGHHARRMLQVARCALSQLLHCLLWASY